MKPIWFTALGCPAIEKGSNQPSAVPDTKSSTSALPYYSNGARDDAIQRAALAAHLSHWAGDAMIDRVLVASWDARPAPLLGQDAKWPDSANWQRGHWISGRLGAAPAEETLRDILARADFATYDLQALGSVVDAVVAGNVTSPRTMIEALAPVHNFQVVESGATVRIAPLAGQPVRAMIDPGSLVSQGGSDDLTRKRAQETDLPRELSVTWSEPTKDDQPASYPAVRSNTISQKTSQITLPVAVSDDKATAIAETLLRAAWFGRETLETILPPSLLALEPGDMFELAGDTSGFRIEEIGDGTTRPASGRRADPSASTLLALPLDATFRTRASGGGIKAGRASIVFIDGPLLADTDAPVAATIGAFAQPWGDGVGVYRSPTTSGYVLDTALDLPAGIGTLVNALPVGPLWRWDMGSVLRLYMPGRVLATLDDTTVLAGANYLAVQQTSGEWEFLQFGQANLVAANTYDLTRLLRGQRGTDFAMGPAAAPIGQPVVLLDAALDRTATTAALKDLALNWRWGPAHLDVANAAYQQQSVTLKGNGLRPFGPVQFRGRRDIASGDWALSWIRRTRLGGDSWALTEVPLNEASEAYTLEILNTAGTAVLRSVALTSPAFTYTAAMQVTDFGAAQTSFKARVVQMSATFGRGIATLEQIG